MITIDEVVHAAPETCWGMVGDKLLLFDPGSRRLHVLNDTAAIIWALTDESMSIGDLVVRAGEEFRAAPSEIEADVVDVVDRLVDAQVCRTEPGGGSGQLEWSEPAPPMEVAPTVSMYGPYDVLGTEVYIDGNDDELTAEVIRILAPLTLVRRGLGTGLCYRIEVTDGVCQLSVNGRLLARGTSRSATLRTLLSDLNATPLELLDDAIVLHAGAMHVGGHIVVFPGVSNSGKSTLMAQLIERGHAYLTDEAVVIGVDDVWARPYAKSLCIEPGSQDTLGHIEPPASPVGDGTWDVDPTTIGPGRVSSGGPVTALVFPIYGPGVEASMRPLDPVEVMHRLLRNSFIVPTIDQAGFAALIRLANDATAFELTHGGVGHLSLLESTLAEQATINL